MPVIGILSHPMIVIVRSPTPILINPPKLPPRSTRHSQHSSSASWAVSFTSALLSRRNSLFLTTGNVTGLKDELGLCAAPSANLTDYAILASYPKQVFSFATELNYPVAQPGRSPVDHPLQAFVNATLAQTDEIQVLNVTNWIWYGGLGWPCIDWANSSSLEQGVSLIQAVPFSYTTCKHLNLLLSCIFSTSP